MSDTKKTKAQLIDELVELRQQIAELETSAVQRRQVEAEREQLLAAEREQRLLAETLAEVTLALTSQTNHPAVLDEILRQAQRIVPYNAANIMLLEDNTLTAARWQGYEAFDNEEFISTLVQLLADFSTAAEAVRLKKPLVIPDTRQDSRWVILQKTAWIRSQLTMPICLHDRVLGLLQLDGDTICKFSMRDAERLYPLVNAAAIALENARLYEQVQQELAERKRAEESLHYRLNFETLTTAISTNFINLPIDKIDDGINQALKMIGEFVGVDYSFVFLLSEDRKRVSNSHNWQAAGVEWWNEKLQDLPVETFPQMMARLSHFETIYIPSVANMPPESQAEQKFLQARGVKSLIQVPMVYNDELRGVLGFASVRVNKTWSKDIILLLKIVSEIFVNALQRKYVDQELKTRAQQQAAVAELGQRALVGSDWSLLLDEAATLVAKTLQMEYSWVLELLPGDDWLLLKAGVGWPKERRGEKIIHVENDKLACDILHVVGPVTVTDTQEKTDFCMSCLFQEHGIKGGASLVIHGRSHPFGILGAYTTKERCLNEDDFHFLQAVANVLGMAIERQQVEQQIQTSLKEKELLLKEVYHRVKNNLQIVSSLLRLQSRSIQDSQSLEMFRDSQNRIKSMALIHEKLYKAEDLTKIDFRKYVSDLGTYLFQSYAVNPAKIGLKLNIEDISLDIYTAIPCGLIINELVSNSLKYAFPSGVDRPTGLAPQIWINLRPNDQNQFALIVSDNGQGLPQAIDPCQPQTLGLQLVTRLTQQLKGKIEIARNQGTSFTITFPG